MDGIPGESLWAIFPRRRQRHQDRGKETCNCEKRRRQLWEPWRSNEISEGNANKKYLRRLISQECLPISLASRSIYSPPRPIPFKHVHSYICFSLVSETGTSFQLHGFSTSSIPGRFFYPFSSSPSHSCKFQQEVVEFLWEFSNFFCCPAICSPALLMLGILCVVVINPLRCSKKSSSKIIHFIS